MRNYVKPQLEVIKLTVNESIATICGGIDFGMPGSCPS